MLTHGSLFAGVGGFDEGFRRSGFAVKWQVEKESFCKAVLRTRFPEAELLEDVRDCGKHNLRAVDVVTAGFPCQDLSVAGKRAGLEGTRSGLFWELRRILGELTPPWFVIENVPGLFSSADGRDFGIVLQSLDELGYGMAWRVLNSQFFGVAQRRRRVFLVGRFGEPCPQEVLFESESSAGDFAESGEAWPEVAVPLTSGVGVTGNAPGRRLEDDFNLAISFAENQRAEIRTSNIVPSLSMAGGKPGSGYPAVATALSRSNGHHGHSSPRGDGADNLVCGPLKSTSDHRITAEDAAGHHIVQQAISSKWAKGSSGPAGDEHHNLVAFNVHSAYSCAKERHAYESERTKSLDSTGAFATNQGGTLVSTALRHLGRGGADDNDAQGGFLHVSAPTDAHRMRSFAGLPQGLDSARYRALGNAVTVKVAEWIGRRIVAVANADPLLEIEK